MKRSDKISGILTSKWYFYILWLIFVVAAVSIIFSLITKTKKENKICCFIASYDCNTEELHSQLNSGREEFIEQLDIMWVSPTDMYFGMYYSTYGRQDADIVIVPESRIPSINVERDFLAIDVSLFEGNSFYELNGKTYGITVFDTSGEGCADDIITYTHEGLEMENYYMFFSKESLHAQSLSGSGSNAALKIAEVLLNL